MVKVRNAKRQPGLMEEIQKEDAHIPRRLRTQRFEQEEDSANTRGKRPRVDIPPPLPVIIFRTEKDARKLIEAQPEVEIFCEQKGVLAYLCSRAPIIRDEVEEFIRNWTPGRTKVLGQEIKLTPELIGVALGVPAEGVFWSETRGSVKVYRELLEEFVPLFTLNSMHGRKGVPGAALEEPWRTIARLISIYIFLHTNATYLFSPQLKIMRAWRENEKVNVAAFILQATEKNLKEWHECTKIPGSEIICGSVLQRVIHWIRNKEVAGPSRTGRTEGIVHLSYSSRTKGAEVRTEADGLSEDKNLPSDNELQKEMDKLKGAYDEQSLQLKEALASMNKKDEVIQELKKEIANLRSKQQEVAACKENMEISTQTEMFQVTEAVSKTPDQYEGIIVPWKEPESQRFFRIQWEFAKSKAFQLGTELEELKEQILPGVEAKEQLDFIKQELPELLKLLMNCRKPPRVYALLLAEKVLLLRIHFLSSRIRWKDNTWEELTQLYKYTSETEKDLLAEAFTAGMFADPEEKHKQTINMLMGSVHLRTLRSVFTNELQRHSELQEFRKREIKIPQHLRGNPSGTGPIHTLLMQDETLKENYDQYILSFTNQFTEEVLDLTLEKVTPAVNTRIQELPVALKKTEPYNLSNYTRAVERALLLRKRILFLGDQWVGTTFQPSLLFWPFAEEKGLSTLEMNSDDWDGVPSRTRENNNKLMDLRSAYQLALKHLGS